mmetsp:Transcript_20831/g.41555  ORF Transcript_20831/g.41555 Transcript_20831/m.41555 type:complete len:95 (-) Transcript_20831:1822-2106(-)
MRDGFCTCLPAQVSLRNQADRQADGHDGPEALSFLSSRSYPFSFLSLVLPSLQRTHKGSRVRGGFLDGLIEEGRKEGKKEEPMQPLSVCLCMTA